MKKLLLCLIPFALTSAAPATYDFKGNFPQLDQLTIENRHQETLELLLPGTYANLKHIDLKSEKGRSTIDLTGTFPSLEGGTIQTSKGPVIINLKGDFKRPVTLNIKGSEGTLELVLPRNYPIRLRTVAPKGKVFNKSPLKEKNNGYFSFKTARSFALHPNTKLPTLTLKVELDKGNIILR